jgi:hypothetical protein
VSSVIGGSRPNWIGNNILVWCDNQENCLTAWLVFAEFFEWKVSSTDGQRWCRLSCATVVLGVKRGLMFLEGCVGLVIKYFFSSSCTFFTPLTAKVVLEVQIHFI